MPECLPDLPRYVRQRDNEWQGADHQNGPWRPIPEPQAGLPWKTDGPAVPESREPASVAAEVRPLSPAAQAALDAYETTHGVSPGLAAAFLAVADHVVPDQRGDGVYLRGADYHRWLERKIIRRQILAIAAKLEGFNV